jgi:hypothetical protein
LNNIVISRAFTIYQLANILINELPKVIQQYGAKMIVVSDLLDIFIRDPQIEANEVKYLINEIVNSITKPRALEDVLVIVSLPYVDSTYVHNDKSSILYDKTILPRFDKCIEIRSNEDDNKMIEVKIMKNYSTNPRRTKNTTNDFHKNKSLSISNRDLLTLSAPTGEFLCGTL